MSMNPTNRNYTFFFKNLWFIYQNRSVLGKNKYITNNRNCRNHIWSQFNSAKQFFIKMPTRV